VVISAPHQCRFNAGVQAGFTGGAPDMAPLPTFTLRKDRIMNHELGYREDSASGTLDFGLDDLPVDVFDVDGSGLTVESLTGGHGMAEVGASCFFSLCICSCSGD
jgi:hypothetical protein